MITPLLGPDTLDRDAAMRQIDRLIAGGVSGLFLLGTTGEAPGLSYRLRRELVELTCGRAKERVPVLVSVTDTSFAESIEAARHAADHGAAGVVIAPPYYYGMSQTELLAYFGRIIPQLILPVYLYNIPSHTRVPIAPETVRDLAHLSNLYGVKDSSGEIATLRAIVRLLADRPEFTVLCGPEEILVQAMEAGAHGGITGGSNLFPELYVELYQAAASGDRAQAERLQRKVQEISRLIYHVTPGESTYLRGMKCALSCLGFCRNIMAEPYQPFGEDIAAKIRAALDQIQAQ